MAENKGEKCAHPGCVTTAIVKRIPKPLHLNQILAGPATVIRDVLHVSMTSVLPIP